MQKLFGGSKKSVRIHGEWKGVERLADKQPGILCKMKRMKPILNPATSWET